MLHDKLPRGRKVFKYALTVADVASRYKAAESLTSKSSDEVAEAFQKIYKRGPLKWPQMLQVDPRREFTSDMENHKAYIRRGRTDIHRDQAIVVRFNRTQAELPSLANVHYLYQPGELEGAVKRATDPT